jgi:aminoglycoside phosphotransferase
MLFYHRIVMQQSRSSCVSQIAENRWLIAQQRLCELVKSSPPQDTIAHWSDRSGRSFCLRKAHLDATSTPLQPFYAIGDEVALWDFAGKIWKVKEITPKMELEGDTIKFVKNNFPGIPVPQVVCYWTDDSRQTSFMVMNRADGRTLDSAWASLTAFQRVSVSETIAGYLEKLATLQSTRLETATGHGIADRFMAPKTATSSTEFPLLRLLSLEEAGKYFQPLEITEQFVFSHGDLNSQNVMVDDHGRVSCFIDWELAGFVPRWWVHFKAHLFAMQLSDERYTRDWRLHLVPELEARGIVENIQACLDWHLSDARP